MVMGLPLWESGSGKERPGRAKHLAEGRCRSGTLLPPAAQAAIRFNGKAGASGLAPALAYAAFFFEAVFFGTEDALIGVGALACLPTFPWLGRSEGGFDFGGSVAPTTQEQSPKRTASTRKRGVCRAADSLGRYTKSKRHSPYLRAWVARSQRRLSCSTLKVESTLAFCFFG
jgi:hypothetical protein